MSIIYSTISPFLLSILVFYPWALALVIWQLGTHDAQSRKNEKSSAQTVECRSQESLLPYTAAHQDQKDTATATSAEFFRSLSLGAQPRGYSSTHDIPLSSCCSSAVRVPRAPPSFLS